MKKELIEARMLELAKSIGYEPNDISHLQKAMYCRILRNPNDGDNRKNYTNDSLATFGDSILKFILSEQLFKKDFDKAQITQKKTELEKTKLYTVCAWSAE